MATTAPAPTTITIDVKNDLESTTALNNLLTSQGSAIFNILGELTKYTTAGDAAAAGASAKVTLTGTANWTTSNKIGFKLTPQASCSIAIATSSESFAVATSIENPSRTTAIQATAPAGSVYVNIDLDFNIQGSVSGSGTFSGVGVAGQASGSANTSLSFCIPVDASVSVPAAIKEAFGGLVFPLDPGCAANMRAGSFAKVNFDGAFNCELDGTYGLGPYKLSAPSVAQINSSLDNIATLTSPSIAVQVGIKGSLTYNHADHFSLIVNKTSDKAATVYLLRSDENDWGASVGVTVGVTSTAPTVDINNSALSSTVQKVTGSSALASAVVNAASKPLNNLQTGLNAKLKSWAEDATGQIGLSAALARNHGRTALFTFDADLTSPQLQASWTTVVSGTISANLPGLTIEAGSGVSESLKRSCQLQFQFFNLFNYSSTSDFFKNAYTEFGPDGTIRIFQDVGQEQSVKTKIALSDFRIHFVATAQENASNQISLSEVDLYIEMSEQASSQTAMQMAHLVSLLPASDATHAALEAMTDYLAKNPKGALNLTNIIKPSAYQRYSFTPYNGSKPLPLPHVQDQNNWNAFQAAAEALLPTNTLIPRLSYGYWCAFNCACTGEQIPDRREAGNWPPPDGFFDNTPLADGSALGSIYGGQATYYLLTSADVMNVFEDLRTLATQQQTVASPPEYTDLLNFITNLANQNEFKDYEKPTAGALLSQAANGSGAAVTTSADLASDSSSLTCTVTIA